MMKHIKNLVFCCVISVSSQAQAGVDVLGIVQQIRVASDGVIWFSINNSLVSTYCKDGWNGMNMYIPAGDASAPYYFGLLSASLLKSKQVFLGNISYYNGSTPCDITKTGGYGLTLYAPL